MNWLAELADEERERKAQKVREAMGAEFGAVADALRETFGAKLSWLKTSALTIGEKPDEGVPTQWRGERKRA
jgi:hypothetical protein